MQCSKAVVMVPTLLFPGPRWLSPGLVNCGRTGWRACMLVTRWLDCAACMGVRISMPRVMQPERP